MKLLNYRILNTIGILLVLGMNYLANALPINGFSTGELSSFYPNLFVPAGITFSIWGVIYLLLIVFIILQWRSSYDVVVKNIGFLFFINCILNSSWILAWHYRFVELSVVVMVFLLSNLIMIYKQLNRITFDTSIDKYITEIPFNIYFGWICVATIANTTALLVDWNFSPSYPEYWTVAMVVATQVLVLLINYKRPNLLYTLTIIWALTGIILKRINAGGPEIIIITCYIAIACSFIIYAVNNIKARMANS